MARRQKIVEQVEQKIRRLIAELQSIDSETVKQAATKAKENVKTMRKGTRPTSITAAKAEVAKAVKAAKEQVKKARKAVKNREEAKKAAGLLRCGDIFYSLVEGTDGNG